MEKDCCSGSAGSASAAAELVGEPSESISASVGRKSSRSSSWVSEGTTTDASGVTGATGGTGGSTVRGANTAVMVSLFGVTLGASATAWANSRNWDESMVLKKPGFGWGAAVGAGSLANFNSGRSTAWDKAPNTP